MKVNNYANSDISKINKALDDVQKLYDKGYTVEGAIRVIKEKGCNHTVQSNGNNQVENNQLKYSTREKFKQTIRKL